MTVAASPLRWSAAAEAAAGITEAWAQEGGPGGAVVVFDTQALRVEASGGLESLATGVPFSGDSVVRYASITKHVLAGLTVQREGVVGLDDPMGQHLPGLRGEMAAVTVGRALDMTGGLPDLRETLSLLGLSVHTATEAPELLDFLCRLAALNFPQGSEVSYSNTGYRLVEAALARKGLAFADLVREEINAPLGIAFSAPELWFDPVRDLVPGYWKSERGWQLANAGLHLSASGSLTGSVRHLALWLQCLLGDRGPARGWLARLSAPRFLADGRPTRYGLGLAWSELGGHRLVGHGGSHAGYKNYFLLHPALGVGVALVSNREDAAPYGLALKVMAALLGAPLPQRSERIPDALYVSDTGPEWLEMKGSIATFLGTGDTLYEAPDGWSVSLSAHLPMRLRATGGAIEGEIGHVARRFRPAVADGCLGRVQGRWVCPGHHAAFDIVGDRLEMGVGPARTRAPLVELGGGRLVAEGRDGPWTKRACLAFSGDRVRLSLNRSRVLTFERAG
ncbi:serine hydrolase domain-containing protein [Chelatococcus sp. SYSU_G07232]|uniref:Serine hydrolase domain-containing protein n=1 Tax=Chelatococcus albus TaxID=3047466 RepID=A0ABT7ALI4_9HYPH|nr:serine hydrolase domain-containing protein [Chelatococcus sp. SYSU_G07232]MDJ1160235.1 serine hydrolase domain-containing protein [Chelatococcus sp. SYSU_G07232]